MASQLAILCFGDSLTAGYQSPTREHPRVRETPYGDSLRALLGGGAEVCVRGVCGELASEMGPRLDAALRERAFTHAVVLGGTNDLGRGARPEAILRDLVAMYGAVRAAGAAPIAVTAPSIRPDGAPPDAPWLREHVALRIALNDGIRAHCAARSIACVDLFEATAEPEASSPPTLQAWSRRPSPSRSRRVSQALDSTAARSQLGSVVWSGAVSSDAESPGSSVWGAAAPSLPAGSSPSPAQPISADPTDRRGARTQRPA